MVDSPEPYLCIGSLTLSFFNTFNSQAGIGLVIILVLLFFSALVSGSEIAYFSLNSYQIDELKENQSATAKRIITLLEQPKYLMATILITNNVVNIAIIVLSTYVTSILFNFNEYIIVGFIIQVILVTFLILLFAEVLPKVYARQNALKFASLMSGPVSLLRRIIYPISSIFVQSTNRIDRDILFKGAGISADELSYAIEITNDNQATEDDKQLLYGIVQFGKIYAREIMKSRLDVIAVDDKTPFCTLIEIIIDAGYSRVPVYRNTFDEITGILYIKDLLPFLDEGGSFEWQKLIRPSFFVPESKKINDLLKEFQEKKIHMAIVVDEYGGTSGIITLEDILEEIVGEINDEFDTEEKFYSKIDDKNFVFEGKTLIKDFCRITGIGYTAFDAIKGEADTMAGLILETKQELPFKGEKLEFDDFDLVVDAVDNRRIKRIKVIIKTV